jgi:CheY-like chemotaxis protein
VSLRILFADDSVTAQNMGKKILTEAGYEVIAVSNGAAAVKKIAEQKPDIIILDVYMPGYSGLEVCEKVRSNIATIKTPVLLTVGKMEPYKPEDANRVRADGVIIKPFEASDLLAIIKKFEERIKAMPAPAVMAPPAPRKAVELYPEPEHPEPIRGKAAQSMVEVPDHMASSSAFSELLGGDSGHSMPQFVAPPPVAPQADETAKLSALDDNDVPLSWRQDNEPQPTVPVAVVQEETSAPVAVSEPEPEAIAEPEGTVNEIPVDEPAALEVSAAAPLRPIQIPVYQDSTPAPAEFMPTASAPLGDIDLPREPELQESAEEVTRSTVADGREADLVPTSRAVEDQQSVSGPVHAAAQGNVTEIAVEAPADLPEADHSVAPVMQHQAREMAVEAAPIETPATADAAVMAAAPAPLPTTTNDDFEARVAAAMAAYTHTQPASPVLVEGGASNNGLSEMPAMVASVSAVPVSVEAPAAAEESHSPAAAESQPEEPVREYVPEAASPSSGPMQAEVQSLRTETGTAGGATADAVSARVEAELPAAASAVAEAQASGADHQNIAQVVHRVMERMKGDLVDEIVRELKSKK